IISNNIANASTTGFKSSRPEFEDLLADQIRGAGASDTLTGAPQTAALEVGMGVRTASTSRSQAQGDLVATQGPLDVAIQGQGFFRVTRANGDPAYTRAGNFRTDAQGHLTTQNGEVLDPEITVPQDATQLTIGSDGTVQATVPGKTQPQSLGTLELSVFQ